MIRTLIVVITFLGIVVGGILFSTTEAKADSIDSSYEYSYTCDLNQCYYDYQIRWGDTLSQLSIDHQMSVEEIARINQIKNPDIIFANDYLTFLKHQKTDDVVISKKERKTRNKEKVEPKNTKENSSKKEHKAKKEKEKDTPALRNIVKENPFSKNIVSDYSL